MDGDAQRTTPEDVLDVFDQLDDSSEPLTTREVAEAVGCARRTAYDKLDELASQGTIRTKQIGAQARAWWRPAGPPAPSKEPTGETDRGSGRSFELTADEVLELEFTSAALAQPFLELGDDDMTLRIDGFVRLPDGSHTQYWTVKGLSGETILRLPKHFSTNVDVRLLKKAGDTFRVEVKGTPSSLVSTYDDFGGTPVLTTLEDGMLRNTVQFPATVDTTAVLQAIRETVTPDFELASQKLVYTPRLFKTIVEDALTARQWTTLQLAYYAGYFRVPRESDGEELAERLGITRQTLNHHLRHAEDTVFSHLFETSDDDDGIRKSNE